MLSGNTWKLVVGIIMLFIAIIFFQVVLDGVGSLLGWSSGGSTIADFTGLSPIVKVTPLLVWLGLLTGSGFFIFSGVRGIRRSRRSGGSKGLH